MESLHSAVAPETTAPVRRLIPGRNRVDAVVIDHPVHGEEEVDTTNVKVILAVGPWVMTILDRSGIEETTRWPTSYSIAGFSSGNR